MCDFTPFSGLSSYTYVNVGLHTTHLFLLVTLLLVKDIIFLLHLAHCFPCVSSLSSCEQLQ